MKNKEKYILISSIILIISIILSFIFPTALLKIRAIGILIACLILWISEAVPMFVSTLFMICLLPFLGLMSFNDAISNFGINTAFFIMATSALTIVISESNIPSNIISKMLNKYSNKPKRLLFFLGLFITIFSGFVSSLATCTLFYSLISSCLKKNDIKNNSNFARDIMMIIPACSGIGGFISPAGTPANLLVIDILKQYNINITFLDWFSIGFPICVLTSLIFILSVVLIYKPEYVQIKNISHSVTYNNKDKLIILILFFVILGWFLSSFYDISTTLIALIAMTIMFIPKIDLLNTKKFASGVNWNLVISMGGVSILMIAISNTNVFVDIINAIFNNISNLPVILILFIISLCICLIRTFIPTTTAVIALLSPILINMSSKFNLNTTSLLLLAAYWAACAFLLVFTEPIYMITYKDNYYKAMDLFKVGIIPTLILSLIVPILINHII